MNPNEQALPQARTNDLVTRELPDEVLVYDLKTHQAHCLNHTAATVWKHCDGQTPAAALARAVSQDLKTDVNEDVVWLALDQLSKSKLLAEKIAKPEAGISRRQMLRRVGVTAVAVPLVTSIIAPSAFAALTCVGMVTCTPGTGDPLCACTGCCAGGVCVVTGGAPGSACTENCQCASNTCDTMAGCM